MIKKKRLPTFNFFSSEHEVCGKCRPATSGIANIIYFFTKQGTLMKRSIIPSILLEQLSQSDVRFMATYTNKRPQWMFYDNQHSSLSYKMVKFTLKKFYKIYVLLIHNLSFNYRTLNINNGLSSSMRPMFDIRT